MRDWPSQCLITTLLHLHFIICGDVHQTIPCSYDGNLNRFDDSLESPFQYETSLESVLENHRGNHVVHRGHRRLSQIIIDVINQLHRVEISASRDFIYDWSMPARIASFTMNNQFLLILDKLHQLVNNRGHNPSYVDERPSRKKVIASVHVQDLKLCVELCRTHLNYQIYRHRCFSLHPIKALTLTWFCSSFPRSNLYCF